MDVYRYQRQIPLENVGEIAETQQYRVLIPSSSLLLRQLENDLCAAAAAVASCSEIMF